MNTSKKKNESSSKTIKIFIVLVAIIVVIIVGYVMATPSADNDTTDTNTSSSSNTVVTTEKNITTTTSSNSTTTTISSNTTTTIQENIRTTITITREDWNRKRTFITNISLPPEAEGKLEVKIHIREDGYMLVELKNIGEQVINESSGFYMGIHFYGGRDGAELKGEFQGRQITWTIMPGETYSVKTGSLWAVNELVVSFKIEILYIL